MEASSEPRLDAKSEVSSNLEGQFSVETGYGCELRHLQIS
ncbi:COMMD6 isoform 13 [Pongo abelii]|uniref:COMMD6 isoform 13 n=1 Tax=Pongo abelii TaxID=9601 RepID=A0A2J8WU24_PONAB|nr:COMMD6 isoform 13 [Pongo abelii]